MMKTVCDSQWCHRSRRSTAASFISCPHPGPRQLPSDSIARQKRERARAAITLAPRLRDSFCERVYVSPSVTWSKECGNRQQQSRHGTSAGQYANVHKNACASVWIFSASAGLLAQRYVYVLPLPDSSGTCTKLCRL